MSLIKSTFTKVVMTSLILASYVGTSVLASGIQAYNSIPDVQDGVTISQSVQQESSNGFLSSIFSIPSASAASEATDVYTQLKDIKGTPFEAYIVKAYQKGIISGNNGMFKADNKVSFVESLKILINAGPKAEQAAALKTPTDKGWQDSFKKLYAAQDATSEKKYADNDSITRDFAVYLMLRQIGVTFSSSDYAKIPHSFPDVNAKTKLAPYVAFAQVAGISNGYADGTFGPMKNVTRGELTKMAWKTLVENKADILVKYNAIMQGTGGSSTTPVTVTPGNGSSTNNPEVTTPEVVTPVATSGISAELAKQIAPAAQKDSQGNIISYRDSSLKTEKQQIEYLTKAKVKLTSGSIDYQYSGVRSDHGMKAPKQINTATNGLIAQAYWSLLTGKNVDGTQTGTPKNIEIPAFAWLNTSFGGLASDYDGWSEDYTVTDFDTSAYVYKDGGAIDKTIKGVESALKGGKASKLGRTVEVNRLTPKDFDASVDAYTTLGVTWAQVASGYNQEAVTQEIYAKMLEMGFSANEWQIKSMNGVSTIAYLPSLLDHETGIQNYGKGTYAINVDTSLFHIIKSTTNLRSNVGNIHSPNTNVSRIDQSTSVGDKILELMLSKKNV